MLNQRPGFELFENFLTAAEEHHYIGVLGGYDIPRVSMGGDQLQRRLVCFGMDFGPNFLTLRPAPPVPVEPHEVRRRCARIGGVADLRLAQAIVQVYPPGAGIG